MAIRRPKLGEIVRWTNKAIAFDVCPKYTGWCIYDLDSEGYLDCGAFIHGGTTAQKIEGFKRKLHHFISTFRPYYIITEDTPSIVKYKGVYTSRLFGVLEGYLMTVEEDRLVYSISKEEWRPSHDRGKTVERMEIMLPDREYWCRPEGMSISVIDACGMLDWWVFKVFERLPYSVRLKAIPSSFEKGIT